MSLEKLNIEVAQLMQNTKSGQKFWDNFVTTKKRVMHTSKCVVFFERFLEEYNVM